MSADIGAPTTVAFAIGDAVVCPHHGVGTVIDQSVRAVGDIRTEYLTIEVERHRIRLLVPTDSSATARLRPLVSRADALRALETLSAPPQPLPKDWRERKKEAESALRSGELMLVARLVRDLARAARGRGLTTTDLGLYEKARGLIEDELRAALDMNNDSAAAAVDQRLEGAAATARG